MESHSASQDAPSRSGLPHEAYDPSDGVLGTIVLAARSYALYRVARCRPGVLRDGDGGA